MDEIVGDCTIVWWLINRNHDTSERQRHYRCSAVRMWSLGERDLFAVVNSFQDRLLLHLRHHFEDKGQWMPWHKGITLTLAEWTVLKNHLEDIDRNCQKEIANLNNEKKIQSLNSRQARPGSYRLHSILFSEEDRQFQARLSRIIQSVRKRDDYQKVWREWAVLNLPTYQRLVREHYATPSPIDIVILLVYTQDLFASVDWYQAELIRYTYLTAIHHHVRANIFLNLCLLIAQAMALHHPTGLLQLWIWSPIATRPRQVLHAGAGGAVRELLLSSSIGCGRRCHLGNNYDGDGRDSPEEWAAPETSQGQPFSVATILAARTSRLISNIYVFHCV